MLNFWLDLESTWKQIHNWYKCFWDIYLMKKDPLRVWAEDEWNGGEEKTRWAAFIFLCLLTTDMRSTQTSQTHQLLNYESEYILLQLNHSVRYFFVIILVKVTHTQKQGGMLILQRVLQFNQFYWRKQWFRGKDFPKNVGSNISESIKDIVTHIQEEDALYLWHI